MLKCVGSDTRVSDQSRRWSIFFSIYATVLETITAFYTSILEQGHGNHRKVHILYQVYSTLRVVCFLSKRVSKFTNLQCFLGWFWRARTKLEMQPLVLSEYSLSVQSPNGLTGFLAARKRRSINSLICCWVQRKKTLLVSWPCFVIWRVGSRGFKSWPDQHSETEDKVLLCNFVSKSLDFQGL